MALPNLLYEDAEFAARYAEISASNVANAAYERPAVQRVVGEVAGLDVLDAGCAGGEHAAWLVARGARVVALDASAAMVDIASARLGATARVLRADLGEPLDLPSRGFDLVLSSLTLHYVSAWDVALGEFRRLLRPGGRLVFSTHHPYLTLAPDRNYHQRRLVTDGFDGYAADPIDVAFFHRPLAAIVNGVVEAGFSIEAVDELPPSDAMTERAPELAARARTQPWFLIVAARLRRD